MAPRPWMRALGSLNEMLDRRAGVVPAGTPLTEGQRDRIRQWVASGRRLVTPHEDLLDRLGFGRTPEVPVSSVRMDGLAEDAIWPQPLPVRPLQSRGLVPAATTGTATIVGTTSVDAGQVLGIAVDPLGAARDGHELLPGLGRLAVTFTAAPPGPARTGAEVYLDPGSLHNGVSGSPRTWPAVWPGRAPSTSPGGTPTTATLVSTTTTRR